MSMSLPIEPVAAGQNTSSKEQFYSLAIAAQAITNKGGYLVYNETTKLWSRSTKDSNMKWVKRLEYATMLLHELNNSNAIVLAPSQIIPLRNSIKQIHNENTKGLFATLFTRTTIEDQEKEVHWNLFNGALIMHEGKANDLDYETATQTLYDLVKKNNEEGIKKFFSNIGPFGNWQIIRDAIAQLKEMGVDTLLIESNMPKLKSESELKQI